MKSFPIISPSSFFNNFSFLKISNTSFQIPLFPFKTDKNSKYIINRLPLSRSNNLHDRSQTSKATTLPPGAQVSLPPPRIIHPGGICNSTGSSNNNNKNPRYDCRDYYNEWRWLFVSWYAGNRGRIRIVPTN